VTLDFKKNHSGPTPADDMAPQTNMMQHFENINLLLQLPFEAFPPELWGLSGQQSPS